MIILYESYSMTIQTFWKLVEVESLINLISN